MGAFLNCVVQFFPSLTTQDTLPEIVDSDATYVKRHLLELFWWPKRMNSENLIENDEYPMNI